jgi:phosphoglucomutase
VSSTLIDRVVADLGRRLWEVPVGFKWFVPGLIDGSVGFGGEESAGASFLRFDGTVWTTDKDGILLTLLASEMTAVTGETPSQAHAALVERFGASAYSRVDAPATASRRRSWPRCPASRHGDRTRGRAIVDRLTSAPRQRCGDRRAEGDDRVGLVRGPAVGDRGPLQDLRRVLPG